MSVDYKKYTFYILEEGLDDELKVELCSFNSIPSLDVFLTYIEWEMNDLSECCINKLDVWFRNNFPNNEIILNNGKKLLVEIKDNDAGIN